MMETLWAAGFVAAQLWAAGNFGYLNNTEQGAVMGDGHWKPGFLEPPAGQWVVPEYPKQAFAPLIGPGELMMDAKCPGTAPDIGRFMPTCPFPPFSNEPGVAERTEERLVVKEDRKTPILPPIKPGEQPDFAIPPDNQEILRALPKIDRGAAPVYEIFRDDIEITTEKLVDRIDPPRFFPLIGPAQLHYCHWKCTVYFTETTTVSYPHSFVTKKRRAELVYIDKDHLHLFVAEQNAEAGSYCPGGHCGPKSSSQTPLPNARGSKELPHRVAPPDILLIESVRLESKKPLSGGEMQNIRGEHLIRPDGTLSLGVYGSAYVAGLTVGQVKCVVEDHLKPYFVDPQVSVDVKAYNSGKIYLITEGAGDGQQVIVLPATGKETVLDVLAQLKPLPTTQDRIWVSRSAKNGQGESAILAVDWKGLTQLGRTETNYELLPGDRLYVVLGPKVVQAGHTEKNPSQQVQIELIVAEVDRADSRRMETGVLCDGTALLGFLQQMRTKGKIKVLAEPRVMTLLGQEALIQSGREVEMVLPTGVGSPPTITRKFVGVEIKFLPKLDNDGKIRLAVHGELSVPDGAVGGAVVGFSAPGFNMRSLDATAVLKDGQTLLVVADDFPMMKSTRKATLFLVTPRLVYADPQADNAEASSAPSRSRKMSLTDIVRLSKRGIAEDIIVRQMELTGSVFNLTVEDILSLHERGVSDNILRAMQGQSPARTRP